jgi:hypothetical protein
MMHPHPPDTPPCTAVGLITANGVFDIETNGETKEVVVGVVGANNFHPCVCVSVLFSELVVGRLSLPPTHLPTQASSTTRATATAPLPPTKQSPNPLVVVVHHQNQNCILSSLHHSPFRF